MVHSRAFALVAACEASVAATIPTGQAPILLALELSILLPGIYLAGALLVGAGVLALIRRWRQDDGPGSPDASDQLAHFRTLYEQGAISEEEFKRLRAVLAVELRQMIDLPPRPTPPADAAADPAPPVPDSEKNGEGKPPSSNGLRPA